jgi:hypothetical protein
VVQGIAGVDLERDQCARACGIELGSLAGPEHDVIAVDEVVHREHARLAIDDEDCDSADDATCQELKAIPLGEFRQGNFSASAAPGDAAAGHGLGTDADPVCLGPRGPRLEFERAQPSEV